MESLKVVGEEERQEMDVGGFFEGALEVADNSNHAKGIAKAILFLYKISLTP